MKQFVISNKSNVPTTAVILNIDDALEEIMQGFEGIRDRFAEDAADSFDETAINYLAKDSVLKAYCALGYEIHTESEEDLNLLEALAKVSICTRFDGFTAHFPQV